MRNFNLALLVYPLQILSLAWAVQEGLLNASPSVKHVHYTYYISLYLNQHEQLALHTSANFTTH